MAETKDTKVKTTAPTSTEGVTSAPAVAKDERFYTAPSDQTEVLEDGREVLVARKGQKFTRAHAVELGLVKNQTPTAPAETK
ncbi:MAG: hypothetical protein MSG64_06385 [Pyrinomonadaceae bacterium MAG19_C2-C3]|nr:hypothetical protein [Pyrinomonadaceae bacterium MAG19_C2-C3]